MRRTPCLLNLAPTSTGRSFACNRKWIDALLFFLKLCFPFPLLLLLQLPNLLIKYLILINHVAQRRLQLDILGCQEVILLLSRHLYTLLLLALRDLALCLLRLFLLFLQLKLQFLILAAQDRNLFLLRLVDVLELLVLLSLVQEDVDLLLLFFYYLVELHNLPLLLLQARHFIALSSPAPAAYKRPLSLPHLLMATQIIWLLIMSGVCSLCIHLE